MTKQLPKEQYKFVRQKLPNLKGLLEGELEYKKIFICKISVPQYEREY